MWKDEAFAIWLNEWAALYPKDSDSFKLLSNIHENFYLMNVVDNDY